MNTRHYPAGSAQGKGGQFAPKNSSATGSGANVVLFSASKPVSALDYVPKTTREGKPRIFFKDLPAEEQMRLSRDFINSHADVLGVSDYYYDNFNTSKIKSDERNMKREMWANEEIEDQLKLGPKKQERKAVIVLGLPGSGKSTIANPLLEQMGAFGIDADNIKERIPEFQKDERMAGAVHQESVGVSKKMMNELAKNGYNLVIGKVGGDYESVVDYLDMCQQNGYEVETVLVDVPFQVAMDRTIGRYDRGETKRLIPMWTIKTADAGIYDTFGKVLQHPSIVKGKIYNNDVEEGQKPELVQEFEKEK